MCACWSLSRDYHINPLADEKNDKSKELIKSKVVEYIDRAEMLKSHLAQANEKRARSAVGANGMANGGPGGGGVKYVHSSQRG